VAEADRALDLAITGVATTLDDDNDDITNAPTMALLLPTVPHGDVTKAPAMMATMMLVLRTMQSQNQAILNCLDAMDDTSKNVTVDSARCLIRKRIQPKSPVWITNWRLWHTPFGTTLPIRLAGN